MLFTVTVGQWLHTPHCSWRHFSQYRHHRYLRHCHHWFYYHTPHTSILSQSLRLLMPTLTNLHHHHHYRLNTMNTNIRLLVNLSFVTPTGHFTRFTSRSSTSVTNAALLSRLISSRLVVVSTAIILTELFFIYGQFHATNGFLISLLFHTSLHATIVYVISVVSRLLLRLLWSA